MMLHPWGDMGLGTAGLCPRRAGGDTGALSCAGSKAKGGAVRFAPSQPPEGAHGHVRFDEKLHDSAVMVTQEKDGSFLVKVGTWGTRGVLVPPWAVPAPNLGLSWGSCGVVSIWGGDIVLAPSRFSDIWGCFWPHQLSGVLGGGLGAPQEPVSLPGDSCDAPEGAGVNVGALLPICPFSTRFLWFGGSGWGCGGRSISWSQLSTPHHVPMSAGWGWHRLGLGGGS